MTPSVSVRVQTPPVQCKVGGCGLDALHVQQIPDGKRGRHDLPDDRCDSRAHHAPLETKDKYRVEDDIGDCARQSGDHGKRWASVRTDDGIHGLAEHIKRKAQRDVKEILLCKAEGLRVDRTAEHRKNAVRKTQIQHSQNKASGRDQHDGVADAAPCCIGFAAAQRHADKGAAAVAHHDRNRQGHHCQRKHDRIGCVAVRAEIACVGDKDLVNDVVERTHQQGDTAGHGILPHELADRLRPPNLIPVIHKNTPVFPPKIRNAQARQIWTYAFLLRDSHMELAGAARALPRFRKKKRGGSATGFTQKRHTL